MRGDHVSDSLLIRAIDDELNEVEACAVDSHLATCEECARRRQRFRHMSAKLEWAVSEVRVASSDEERDRLEHTLEARELAASAKRASPALRRWSWAMAIAAALAFGLMFTPQWNRAPKASPEPAAVQPSAFDVDGESFVALPYSNPELPLNTSHIVQMQVPVSELADAGIVFEPISNEIASSDRSVRADVLLGMDGRPVGIHVLSNE